MKHSNHIPTSSGQVHELALQVTVCVMESVDSCTHHLCYQVNDSIFFWAYAHLWRLMWIDTTEWPAVFACAATDHMRTWGSTAQKGESC
jgi:hypothetical protein